MSPQHQRLVTALLALALLLGYSGPAPTAHAVASGPFVPQEVIVRLLPPLLGSVTTLANTVASQLGLTVVDRLGTQPVFRLRIVNSLLSVPALVNLLNALPVVLYAEPNLIGQAPEGTQRSGWAKGGDEGGYQGQWAPHAMRLAEAHTITRGAGVVVAVLDTGVDLDHPALAGRLLPGYDFVDFDADPSEVGVEGQDIGYGHGTHVAGLVALAAPEAQIMPLRVLNPDGTGSLWVLAQAVRYSAGLPGGGLLAPQRADVINISYSVSQRSLLLDEVLGIVGSLPGSPVVVAAAGNSGPSTAKEYPAGERQPGVLAVAATTEAGALASFSTRGDWVDVAAPGEGILSSVPDDAYATWSGTSMAAPLVAGTAALVLAQNPSLRSGMVAEQIVTRAVPIEGARRVDAASALGLPPAAQ